MAKKRAELSRREFLVGATMATGGLALASLVSVPAQAAQAEPKLGAQFIGKLEGPEIIRDAAKFPKTFDEAPMLAELVKAGKLPPVEQRLPEPAELMVVKPLKEIGKYGGRWRRGFTGPADNENGNRIVSTDKLLMWDYTGNKVAPCLAKDWRLSDDGKVMTIFLRKGLRWSDGQPFTADDFLFWYTDIYQNKDLVPTPAPEFTINGKPGPHGQAGRLHRDLRISRAVLPLRRHPGRRHAHRRRAGHPDARAAFMGALRAGALPQAVPAQVLLGGRSAPARPRPPASTAG